MFLSGGHQILCGGHQIISCIWWPPDNCDATGLLRDIMWWSPHNYLVKTKETSAHILPYERSIMLVFSQEECTLVCPCCYAAT